MQELQSEARRELKMPYQFRQTDTALKTTLILKKLPMTPFTFLELGANVGMHSFRIAAERPACLGVVIEGGSSKAILKAGFSCIKPQNLILSTAWITEKMLTGITMRFDYVLALDFIHWFQDWEAILATILRLGKNIIICIPPDEDRLAVGQEHNEAINDVIQKLSTEYVGLVYRQHSDKFERIHLIVTSVIPSPAVDKLRDEIDVRYPGDSQ